MRLAVACIGLLLLFGFAPPVQALRCGNDLVREGDPAYRVQQACGEPDWVASHHWNHGVGEEVWHYNFGPGELIRVMPFRGGRLRRVETAGRGFIEDRDPGGCRLNELAAGMSAPELLQRCGEPVQREAKLAKHHGNQPYLWHRGRIAPSRPVIIEDWYYEFGSRHLPRRIRLMDGIVAEIETVN